MNFCTSIHCMDGSIQEPIIKYLKENYKAENVDSITELSPCHILASLGQKQLIDSIRRLADVSVKKHGSSLIAVSGHADCVANQVSEEKQKEQVLIACQNIKAYYPAAQVIGLWVSKAGEVELL
ncbi:MAG: carbonic anhydrase [Candidatus Omnitrophota bacterium]